MIKVGGIKLKDLSELRSTWTREGDQYTSPDKLVTVRLSGRAKIGDNSKIGDRAFIGDGYNLPVPPLWFSGPRYSIGYHSPGMVNSGCITAPIQWWEENVRREAEEHKYTPTEIEEYVWRIKVLAEWMKRWNVYELPAGDQEARHEARAETNRDNGLKATVQLEPQARPGNIIGGKWVDDAVRSEP